MTSADQILAGIWHVTTASHGGIILSPERQAAMPPVLRRDEPCYEEDVDWALVYLAFEAELRRVDRPAMGAVILLAHDTARAYHPQIYSLFTGTEVPPRESHILRSIAAYQAAIGEIVVVAAYGSHADWVPEGKTGVLGRRVLSVDHLGFATFENVDHRALVDAGRYDDRGIVSSFVSLGAEPLP
ncbi:hypothetical protein H5V43_22030 (plasmid) [Sphingobium fuliginis]|uniref:DUF7007 domain-containing protein n=1 Tax=Sphingobium fuliginis (strain ATCC 27551) TaxID=336203 RepID=A0A7M2GPD8_SPHSA|nr:hypothetical protein H5V43_22030 [Sphingobium fuliginis]